MWFITPGLTLVRHSSSIGGAHMFQPDPRNEGDQRYQPTRRMVWPWRAGIVAIGPLKKTQFNM